MWPNDMTWHYYLFSWDAW